jgi:hypothetical protein
MVAGHALSSPLYGRVATTPGRCHNHRVPGEPKEPQPLDLSAAARALGSLGGKKGGRKGGLQRAKNLSKERRSEIAAKAAAARWAKHSKKP